MTELKGKVAAVTGAASGLGRAMALAFASEGMDVALADVDEKNLLSVQKEMEAKGVRAFCMRVDVSKQSEVDAFAAKAGKIHLVCNNAGVSPLGAAWENTPADWQWILGVNLWGVIHGVRAFVPRLIEQNEGHVVNTASVAGLISPPGSGAYNVTKHAVVALSETLHHDLRSRGGSFRRGHSQRQGRKRQRGCAQGGPGRRVGRARSLARGKKSRQGSRPRSEESRPGRGRRSQGGRPGIQARVQGREITLRFFRYGPVCASPPRLVQPRGSSMRLLAITR